MENISFSKEEKEQMVRKLQLYFSEELDQTIGSFDAGFLLDFIATELGAYYYNRGLYDAAALVEGKLQEMSDHVLQLEQAVNP